MGLKEINLSQGKVAIVDETDFDWLNQWKWSATRTYCRARGVHQWYAARYVFVGYGKGKTKSGKRRKKQQKRYMHREIMKCPKGMIVDHREQRGTESGLFNSRANLFITTAAHNNRLAFARETGAAEPIEWN